MSTDTDTLKVDLMASTRKDDRGHWRCDARASDGSFHLGKGLTYLQAIDDAIVKLKAHEDFLALSPEDQLREIMKKDQILDNDKERCIRLLTELVLGDKA